MKTNKKYIIYYEDSESEKHFVEVLSLLATKVLFTPRSWFAAVFKTIETADFAKEILEKKFKDRQFKIIEV